MLLLSRGLRVQSFLALLLLWRGRGLLHSVHVSDGSRQQVAARMAEAQQRCPRFRVVDIGAAMNPWTLEVADAIADRTPDVVKDCFQELENAVQVARFCCRAGNGAQLRTPGEGRGANISCFTEEFTYGRCCKSQEPRQLLRFTLDVNKESAWGPLLQHVEVAGKFDYAVASHVVEDVMNPEILIQMLPRVARRGYISMPSKFTELRRGVEGYGPHRGHIHHRWIGTVQSGKLVLVPKLSFLETVQGPVDRVGDALTADSIDLSFEWEDDLPFSILNDGFVGPTPIHVIQMYSDTFQMQDDVDAAYETRQAPRQWPALSCTGDRPAQPDPAPAPPPVSDAPLSSVQFCALSSFEGLSTQLASQLGATGERCFHRELQEVRQRCLVAMKAIEASMRIYHTCVAVDPPVGSTERSASCQEAAAVSPPANASIVLAACLQQDEGSQDSRSALLTVLAKAPHPDSETLRRRAVMLRCARAAALVRPQEIAERPMDVGVDCLPSEALKTAFYADLAKHFSQLPWLSLRHPFLPRYDRTTFLEFAQSLPTWVSWMFELWFFYDNVFLPQFRDQPHWGSYAAPLFRLPPWAVPRGLDQRQVVLERLVEMLAYDRPSATGRGVSMAEVGVFMGETCASLIAKKLPLEAVHLVDLWDNNPTYRDALREKSHLGKVSANEARKRVEQRFAKDAVAYCFDGFASAHKPYKGPVLPLRGPWGVSLCPDTEDMPGLPRVGIHATNSLTASSRLPSGSLDLVFIDGAHDYENVKKDLKAWWSKLRPGGVMAGHDFSMSFPGLMRAVLEFVSQLPGRTEVYLDMDYSFWFFKPMDLAKRRTSWRPRLEGGARGERFRARVT